LFNEEDTSMPEEGSFDYKFENYASKQKDVGYAGNSVPKGIQPFAKKRPANSPTNQYYAKPPVAKVHVRGKSPS
jgi:hypothetical protein